MIAFLASAVIAVHMFLPTVKAAFVTVKLMVVGCYLATVDKLPIVSVRRRSANKTSVAAFGKRMHLEIVAVAVLAMQVVNVYFSLASPPPVMNLFYRASL